MLIVIALCVAAVAFISILMINFRPHSKEDHTVALLQRVGGLWCIMPLENSGSVTKNGFICSDEFIRITGTKCPSWGALLSFFGQTADVSFQNSVQNLLKNGHADPIHAHFNGRVYRVIMQLSQDRVKDKDSGEEYLRKDILLTLNDVTELQKVKELYDNAIEKINDLLRVLNTLPFPVWTRSSDGNLTFCNTAYAKLLETQPYQVLSRQWELVDGASAKEAKNLHKDVLLEKKAKTIEVKKKLKGEEKAYKIYEDAIEKMEQSSDEYAVVGTAIDMSDSLVAAKIQQKNAQLYSDTLNLVDLPFGVVNRAGKIIMFNKAIEKLLGVDLSANEVFVDDVLEKLRNYERLPGDVDFVTLKNMCHKWIEHCDLPFHEMWHMPFGVVLDISVSTFQNDYIMITLRDITQVLKAESRYKSLQSVWNAIIDQSRDAVLIIGIDHKIQRCSASASNILNRDAPSLIGLSVKEFLKTFATQHVLHIWQSNLEDAIELRNPHTVTISASGCTLLCEYVPLPDGWHMLRFSKCFVEERFNTL
ncbi:MAG: PAS domain-containing protein, partial [Holosporales bacterium]|nr:PAS domain-containing protein [Holosporales bacterium]